MLSANKACAPKYSGVMAKAFLGSGLMNRSLATNISDIAKVIAPIVANIKGEVLGIRQDVNTIIYIIKQ